MISSNPIFEQTDPHRRASAACFACLDELDLDLDSLDRESMTTAGNQRRKLAGATDCSDRNKEIEVRCSPVVRNGHQSSGSLILVNIVMERFNRLNCIL